MNHFRDAGIEQRFGDKAREPTGDDMVLRGDAPRSTLARAGYSLGVERLIVGTCSIQTDTPRRSSAVAASSARRS